MFVYRRSRANSGVQGSRMRTILLIAGLLCTPLTCFAESLVTIACGPAKGSTQYYGVLDPNEGASEGQSRPLDHLYGPEPDVYNATRTFVVDSGGKKLRLISEESAVQPRKVVNAREIPVINYSRLVITALDSGREANDVAVLYSFYPKLGFMFETEHYLETTYAGQTALFAKCEFSAVPELGAPGGDGEAEGSKAMALSTLIQIIAAALGVIGSLFFTIGILRQNPATMAALAGSYFDFNPHAVPALAAQKADYIFGGLFIVLAFAAQMGSFLASPTTAVAVSARAAALIAIPATIVVFVALYRVSRLLASCFERQIRQAVERGRLLKPNRLADLKAALGTVGKPPMPLRLMAQQGDGEAIRLAEQLRAVLVSAGFPVTEVEENSLFGGSPPGVIVRYSSEGAATALGLSAGLRRAGLETHDCQQRNLPFSTVEVFVSRRSLPTD